jgi:hypothetical protein
MLRPRLCQKFTALRCTVSKTAVPYPRTRHRGSLLWVGRIPPIPVLAMCLADFGMLMTLHHWSRARATRACGAIAGVQEREHAQHALHWCVKLERVYE